MANTISISALRLYRTAGDGARIYFSTTSDRQIPLVPGVSIACALRSEVDAVLAAARDGGLVARVQRPSHPTPTCLYLVTISDCRREPADDLRAAVAS